MQKNHSNHGENGLSELGNFDLHFKVFSAKMPERNLV